MSRDPAGRGRVARRVRAGLALALLAGALAACSADEAPKLEGARIPLRAGEAGATGIALNEERPAPAQQALADWTQLNGDASHAAAAHVKAPSALSRAWSADAGVGATDTLPTAQPVVVDGRVFVRDGGSGVRAFDAGSGAAIWTADLTMPGEDAEEGFGGGLAMDDGRLYAATGFGEVYALSPASGEVLWSRRFDAPIHAPPAASGGQVFVVARDNSAYALDGATGEIAWRLDGVASRTGNLGGSAPAALRSVAAIPFGSGELVLVRANRGLRLWGLNLASGAGGEGLAAFSDVTSAPVIQGTEIFAGNAGDRLVAIDGRTGRVRWQRAFGALSPVWAAGDSIYVATTTPQLMRLDAATGATLWSAPLEAFSDPVERTGPIVYGGPVLAGGRVLTTSSNGWLLVHDPVTGAALNTLDLPGGSSTGPVVAGGGVYVLSDAGELIAFR